MRADFRLERRNSSLQEGSPKVCEIITGVRDLVGEKNINAPNLQVYHSSKTVTVCGPAVAPKPRLSGRREVDAAN